MAIIKKHPALPDYFVEMPEIQVGMNPKNIPSITATYETPKVMVFPAFKPKIDFEFWASLETAKHPMLKKVMTHPKTTGLFGLFDDSAERVARLTRTGLSTSMAKRISSEIGSVLDQILPIYRALFAEYKFTDNAVCWRLSETYAENLHIDVYHEPLPGHFARMFINLDNQPRIWHTSWTAEQVIAKARAKIDPKLFEDLSDNDLWKAFNYSLFGQNSRQWWDDQPRHLIFFEPGDVWSVDSRLVAHQVLYGRRAASIDFVVDAASMHNPDLHYLKLASAARRAGPVTLAS